ncbi:hypothetical protein BZA77DRAFT_291977 [Pyronema omphalodes]|nr:hypothetical protein BZA77DRAFT_291977 [Pyronema omphalodes]
MLSLIGNLYIPLLLSSLNLPSPLTPQNLTALLLSPFFLQSTDVTFHLLLHLLDIPILQSYNHQTLQWSSSSPVPEILKFPVLFPLYLLSDTILPYITHILRNIPPTISKAYLHHLHPYLPPPLAKHLSVLSHRAPLNLFPRNSPILTLTPSPFLNHLLSALVIFLQHPPLYRAIFLLPGIYLLRGDDIFHLSSLLDNQTIPCTGENLPGDVKFVVAYMLMAVVGWGIGYTDFGLGCSVWECGISSGVDGVVGALLVGEGDGLGGGIVDVGGIC